MKKHGIYGQKTFFMADIFYNSVADAIKCESINHTKNQ